MIMKSIDIGLYILFGLCLSAAPAHSVFLSHSHSHVCMHMLYNNIEEKKNTLVCLLVVYGRSRRYCFSFMLTYSVSFQFLETPNKIIGRVIM